MSPVTVAFPPMHAPVTLLQQSIQTLHPLVASLHHRLSSVKPGQTHATWSTQMLLLCLQGNQRNCSNSYMWCTMPCRPTVPVFTRRELIAMPDIYACLGKFIDQCEIRKQFPTPLLLIYYSVLCLSLNMKHFKFPNHTTYVLLFTRIVAPVTIQ